MNPPLLAVRGVAWEPDGRRVLGPLDLEVSAGECLFVVGPNGAGKTTLLRLLAGVLAPSRGEVLWQGTPFTRLRRRELARRIAYVPQIRPAHVPFTVAQLVELGRYPHLARLQFAPTARDREAAARALDRVGIADLARRPLDELSGGERQAAYVAAALAQEAEVLVLDEPTAHLDPRHQRDVAALLLRLNREAAQTVVAASHDLNLTSRVAGRVLALKQGRILACEPPPWMLRPELLERLFDVPFELVRGGDHPVNVPELAP